LLPRERESFWGTYDSTKFCSFKIKFDQKYLTNPYITVNRRFHFEKKIDQNGFLFYEVLFNLYKKV